MTVTNITFTLYTATAPINKKITLSEDGSLIKESLAHQAYSGGGTTATVYAAHNLTQYGVHLDTLNENQCHSYGIPKKEWDGSALQIVTKEKEQREPQEGYLSRSRDNFHYTENKPGIMMFDYDPPASGESHTSDELVSHLREVCPELNDVEILNRNSASSNIHNAVGEVIQGVAGQRLYILVSDASLIPEFAKRIQANCWLKGYGRYEVSSSGNLLERGLFDFSVYQPERLDFCGRTVLGPGLSQHVPPSRLIPGGNPILELSADMLTITEEERQEIDLAKRLAQAAVAEEQSRVKSEYIEEKVQKQIAKGNIPEGDDFQVAQIRRNVQRAVEHKILCADFEITLQNGDVVTVAQILDDPAQYHMSQCHDPLEPEYGNSDPRIGLIRIYGGRPSIYSHAHGGQLFRLVRATREIELIASDSPTVVAQCVELLRLDSDTFIFGNGDDTVLVNAPTENCGVSTYDVESITLKLETLVDFYKPRVNNDGERVRVIKDCPPRLAKILIGAKSYWGGIPRLDGVVNHPLCRPDGSLVIGEGYDKVTKTLLVKTDLSEDWHIAPDPNIVTAGKALYQLLYPFRLFPFETTVDRSVFLAAMMTAVVRPVVTTTPGFLLEATTPGTGKTLLAQCIGALQTGQTPPASAPPETEEELQKVLLSSLLTNSKTILFDNIEKPMKSAALCGFLTSHSFGGRVLGASRTVNLPNRTMLMLTGNNVSVLGDLNRRILRCKIVADVERPDKREFDFCPLEYTKAHRLEMIKAVLTLIRAAITHKAKRPNNAGSYNQWNQLVRSTVCWLAETRSFGQMVDIDGSSWSKIPELTDPLKAFDAGFDADPELQNLGLLLSVLLNVFANKNFSVADIVSASQAYHLSGMKLLHQELALVVNEIASDRSSINNRKLGQYLQRYIGRIVGGLVLINSGKNRSSKCNMFRIESKISGVTGISGVSELQYREKVVDIFNKDGLDQTPDTTVTPEYDQSLHNVSDSGDA